MTDLKTTLVTDNKANPRLNMKITGMVIKLEVKNADTGDFVNEFTFENMLAFIEHIVKHGMRMIEDIEDGELNYSVSVSLPQGGFIYSEIKDKFDLFMNIRADFISEENAMDKKALSEISKIASDRISWYKKMDQERNSRESE